MNQNKNLDSQLNEHLRHHFDTQPRPDFLPALKNELMGKVTANQSLFRLHKTRRTAWVLASALTALVLILFITPVRDAIGQVFVELFQKAESNILPNPIGQTAIAGYTQTAALGPTNTPDPLATMTPKPTRPYTPDSQEFATFSIEEVEELAGFDVLAPTYLPIMQFYGANYDPETNIVYLFYDGHMLVMQEPISGTEECDLCSEIGATARITPVQIGDAEGGYVAGYWIYDNGNKYWRSDPWMQRIRWQSNETVFEIIYDGHPGNINMDDLIAIAESFQ